ncbi:MAG: ATP-binding protein [Acidobacteriota bacterium]|nr:ATP-binding protein [Acidobacteriota bacterium]
MDSSLPMPTHRRVANWLALAAVLLLILGTLTFQRITGRDDGTRVAVTAPTSDVGVSQGIVVVSTALAILSVLIAALQVRTESRHREQIEIELQEALASVEHQVTDRTEALSRAMAELRESEQQFRLLTDQLHLALDERAEALARAEAARRVAEDASRLKDEFLATASHELRTPLNAIVGWVHVLQSGAALDAEQRLHAVGAIDRNAKVQTRLIEDLLDVSRMNQGRVTLTVAPIDVRAVVDAAVESIRPSAIAKKIDVRVVAPFESVPVIGDAPRLQQVVWNLLANAVKFTPGGGTISVEVKNAAARAEIIVSDTGDGIGPEFLPHIFEPFRQGNSSSMRTGMGLGLAIVQRLVELHGGRITATSAGVGHGAQFQVALPLAPESLQTVTVANRPEPLFNRLHVLVAEDDVDSAAALTAILRLHGCETKTAGTAAECLRITGEWSTDVLVCDIGLPDDDGYSLLRRLRNLPDGGRIPAIALTARARPEDRARALAAGFRAHLCKPLDPASLLREIASAVQPASLPSR